MTGPQIRPGDLDDPRVAALLRHHLVTARAETAQGCAHALDIDQLRAPDISLWTLWQDDDLLAVGALKTLDSRHGEVKSMHVAIAHRRHGVGALMLAHIAGEARRRGMTRLSLETGSWDYFAPARALYRRYGFQDSAPFADYRPDTNSVFLTLELESQ